MTVYRSWAASLELGNGEFQPEVLFLPPAGLVFVPLPLPKKVDTKLVLTGPFEKRKTRKKPGADTRNQTLLELMTRPSEMCCVARRENTAGLK